MERAASMFLLFTILNFHKIYAAEFGTISGSMFLTEGDTLVSMTGVFELGVFKPEGSENRYLGIWYKKIAPQTVVWVANRNRPLPGASPLVLRVSDAGSLVLFNNRSMIWSSNTTLTSSNATAKLYDNGNLVLLDQQEKVIWQSFDFLTDTLLPGMKLGKDFLRGIEWHLSSWKSNQDPAPGAFTWGANTSVYPENKLRQGAMVTFRGGPWRNERFTGVSVFSTVLTFTYDVVVTEREVSFSYNLENRSSLLSRVTLNSSGDFISWAWVEESKKWQTVLSLPRDICDTYNICSAYGTCSVDLTQQSCTCLDEKKFVPRSKRDWGMANWSGGCVRRTPLDCKIGSEGFIKYSNVKLPDTHNTWYNTSMTLKECEAKCLKNCTCMAYANTNVRGEGTGCLIWLSDLIDIRVFPEGSGGRDIYVRMASYELGKEKKGAPIKIILPLIFMGLLLLGVSITWFWCARRKKKYVDDMAEEGKSLNVSKGQEEAMDLPIFSFSSIEKATSNFSPENKIGEGGFGVVYKGMLEEGKEIAVKRLSRYSNQGVDEFKNEVICISKLQHRNLVKLLGCCIQGDEKLLIYEYMPNKSLDAFIFDKTQSMILDWTKRFNIIKGIARGLLYLHQDSRLRIIHRDLKASNVLLDEDLNPKISDFGIARSFGGNETQANTERVVGTYGYMSPEYALDGIFSTKSDVFSFGVLVLEIVSGKRNRGFVQPGSDNNLIGHTWSLYSEGRSMELIDPNLAESCRSSEVLRSIELGLLCVQQNAVDRPSMSSVILMLSGEGALPQPKQPAFFMDKEFLVADFSSSTYPGGSVNDITITEVDAR